MDFEWLWFLNIGSVVLINVPLVEDVNDGGGCAFSGGAIWGISPLSLQFFCEPKSALKEIKMFKLFFN